MPDGFTLAAAGDLIYLRPMLDTLETRSSTLLSLLRTADVTFGNFETMAFDLSAFKGSPQVESGGSWLLAEPAAVKDVKSMGFDIVSLANNHSTDWGVEGLVETERALSEEGLVYAGTGRSLQSARAPRYLDGAKGRVALVAASSTITPMSPAADPLEKVPGRTGLNPLRVKRFNHVSPAHLEALAQIAATSPFPPADAAKGFHLLGLHFRPAPLDNGKMTYSYEINRRDAEGNMLAVRQGKHNSNFAVFTLHNHEPNNETDTPADFAIAIARRAIDEGADAYVGHGPHILRGIEIYKGKPIFYSLGNFAMMSEAIDALPRDMFEKFGVDPESPLALELLALRTRRFCEDERLYESVIAISHYVGGKVAEVRLYPIELERKGAESGLPRMANSKRGRRILERLQFLSKPFGTHITIERGVGLITP